MGVQYQEEGPSKACVQICVAAVQQWLVMQDMLAIVMLPVQGMVTAVLGIKTCVEEGHRGEQTILFYLVRYLYGMQLLLIHYE